MKLPRRKFLHLAASAAALPAMSRIAMAQAYPSRPVRLMVGFPAGVATDITARLMGQWLSEGSVNHSSCLLTPHPQACRICDERKREDCNRNCKTRQRYFE
jgi:hypothetical protein